MHCHCDFLFEKWTFSDELLLPSNILHIETLHFWLIEQILIDLCEPNIEVSSNKRFIFRGICILNVFLFYIEHRYKNRLILEFTDIGSDRIHRYRKCDSRHRVNGVPIVFVCHTDTQGNISVLVWTICEVTRSCVELYTSHSRRGSRAHKRNVYAMIRRRILCTQLRKTFIWVEWYCITWQNFESKSTTTHSYAHIDTELRRTIQNIWTTTWNRVCECVLLYLWNFSQ